MFRRLSDANLGPAKNQSAGRRIQSLTRGYGITQLTSPRSRQVAQKTTTRRPPIQLISVANDPTANTITVNKDQLLRLEY